MEATGIPFTMKDKALRTCHRVRLLDTHETVAPLEEATRLGSLGSRLFLAEVLGISESRLGSSAVRAKPQGRGPVCAVAAFMATGRRGAGKWDMERVLKGEEEDGTFEAKAGENRMGRTAGARCIGMSFCSRFRGLE